MTPSNLSESTNIQKKRLYTYSDYLLPILSYLIYVHIFHFFV